MSWGFHSCGLLLSLVKPYAVFTLKLGGEKVDKGTLVGRERGVPNQTKMGRGKFMGGWEVTVFGIKYEGVGFCEYFIHVTCGRWSPT